MLVSGWAGFLERLQARAPELVAEAEALVSRERSGGAWRSEATIPRQPGVSWVELVAPSPSAEGSSRYEVLGHLGRGGMGTVERVRDRLLHRVVARKVLHAALPVGARERFLEEARTTAQLQHPGIVPVHDMGEEPDGRVWFTMKEVQGETFRSVIRREHAASRSGAVDRSASLRRLVSTFDTVCQAVGYAHARGVVHRDLKPTNVMVGKHGEVLVLDWGIAKLLGVEGAVAPASEPLRTGRRSGQDTEAGSVLGTPAFMSPEQARGEEIDARSDVYALGAVLYEMLTGAAPYRGDTPSVLAALLAGPPASLRGPAGAEVHSTFGTDVTELVEVCERAMARSASDRYADGAAVGAAVQSWLDGSRRREQALEVVSQALAQRPAAEVLRARAAALRLEAQSALQGIEGWRPEEDKALGWAKDDEAARMEEQAMLAELDEESLLRASLTHAPELPEARAALAERYQAQHAAAEASRVSSARLEVLVREHLVQLPAGHPVRRSGFAYLKGDGALTLETDPPGAEVALFRYETQNRRLVPVPVGVLGHTPLRSVPLPMGSYLCVLRHPERAEVRYPVHLGRGEHWDGVPPDATSPHPVRLPTPESLGPDDVYVPAGWFWSGGDPEAVNSLPRRRLWCDGWVVRRFPVTDRAYLAFLDDLVATGREAEAAQHEPRERGAGGAAGAAVYGRDGAGRHVLQPDADGDMWDLDWPVCMVDWHGASAYAAWEAARTGRGWRLAPELVWEKAARGVDGRFFPWGDPVDPSWACLRDSHRGRPMPQVVDSFLTDVSVYGVRGMGGSMRDWCSDGYAPEGPPLVGGRVAAGGNEAAAGSPVGANRAYRGGSWSSDPRFARVAYRGRLGPGYRGDNLGFRLARTYP